MILCLPVTRVYRLDGAGNLEKADEKFFQDEVFEMEAFVKKNSKILGDVFVFGEQVTSSGRDKRTDLLAVDRDGEIQVIELKKDRVDSGILTQVLGYKVYWKRHPDSVKTVWAESANKPPDVKPDWDNYDPKVVVVAPSFDKELVEIVGEENLGIRFVQVGRYVHGDSTFIVVEDLEPVEEKIAPVTTRIDYGWDWYAKEIATEAQIRIAQGMHESLSKFINEKGWQLETRFNKWYISFKYGSRRPFWLDFRGSKFVGLGTNLTEEKEDPALITKVSWQWDRSWQYWYTEVDSVPFDTSTVAAALEHAYHNAVGA